MKPRLFYFEKLTAWDKWSIGLYLLLSVGLGWLALSLSPASGRNVIAMYAFMSSLYLYLFSYKSIRKPTGVAAWGLVGLIHLAVYLQLKDLPYWEKDALGLRNTLPLLLLIQVFRFISLRLRSVDLVPVGKRYVPPAPGEQGAGFWDLVAFNLYLGAVLWGGDYL